MTDEEMFFVTRRKSNAKYRINKRRTLLKDKGLTCDQTIEFTGPQVSKKCPVRLRRVGYSDVETSNHYVFLTNNFKLAAKTIADVYKARWQVELFFKWIKQNLKIKSFVCCHAHERRNDLNMDSDVRIPANCISEISISTHKKYAAAIAIIAAQFV